MIYRTYSCKMVLKTWVVRSSFTWLQTSKLRRRKKCADWTMKNPQIGIFKLVKKIIKPQIGIILKIILSLYRQRPCIIFILEDAIDFDKRAIRNFHLVDGSDVSLLRI